MAEISTNIILDGITLALRSAFPGSHIESNAVKQGLRQPAFIVLLVNAEVTDYPAQRKKRLPRFDVLYFPKAGREDCYGVADTLTEVLEVIDLPGGDKLRGTDMSFQVTDGVLHFLVFVVMDDGVIGLKNLLGYHRMNKEWTNEGGWLACDMRRYLNEEVIALLPDALIAAIKPRKFGKEEDKLWLFSEMEVFGEHDWTENDPDRGFQFEYFKDRRNRIKVDEDGDASWWWERSPYGSSSSGFCSVSSVGAAHDDYANAANGVCFGFYI